MKRAAQTIDAPSSLIRRSEGATRFATALVGMAFTIFAGLLGLTRAGDPLTILSYDMPFAIHRAGGTERMRMVYLTEMDGDSLDRRPQARLLDRLGEEGAAMVVYDLIFERPSEDPQVDKDFAAAMRRFRGVDAEGNAIPGAPHRYVFLGCARDTSRKTGYAMETLVVPNNTLLDASDGFGLVTFDEDSFMIRRLSTGTPDEPSLGWVAAQAAGAQLDEDSRMDSRWFNFAGPPPGSDLRQRTVPIESVDAGTLLSGQSLSGFFRGKIVVAGGQPGIVAQKLGADLFETPFHRFPITGKIPLMSGVEVQANALANLLNHNWLTRSPDSSDQWLVIIAGVMIGGMLALLRPVRAIFAAVTVMGGFAAAGLLSVHNQEIWFPWTVPALLQTPVALVWGIASNTYIERFFRIKLSAEQLAIRAAFSKYLSPQMLDRMTAEGFSTNLGGEKIHATMMFTDLENFTNMCERVQDPQRIVETMNGYFERTTGSIFDHEGIIVKFIGDAIFAAWGAPIPDPESPVKAVRAAWKLFESDKLVVEGEELRTRIGIHFGEVVAGNIGSSRRVDYTLIGDAVNLASRLEGINKVLGTSILMSAAVASHLDGSFRVRRVGTFRVKGRTEPVEIHELLGPAREANEPAWIATYRKALAALEAGDHESALTAFAETEALRAPAGDGPSSFFREKILGEDPPTGGIVDLKEK